MEQRVRVTNAARSLMIAAAAWLLAVASCGDALAQTASQNGDRYFIDFRARRSTYIGHTYIVYFRVDANGHVVEKHVAGLVPEENVWNGMFSPIRAAIRKYKDDMTRPPTAIYRRSLTAAEFRRVVRTVGFLKANQHRWHVIFFNCNDFGIEIAEALGMRRPPSLMPPVVWVKSLQALNGD